MSSVDDQATEQGLTRALTLLRRLEDGILVALLSTIIGVAATQVLLLSLIHI